MTQIVLFPILPRAIFNPKKYENITLATVRAGNAGKILGLVMLGLAVVFAVAIFAFGYEMTGADVPGSLVAEPMVAYLLHLLIDNKNDK